MNVFCAVCQCAGLAQS